MEISEKLNKYIEEGRELLNNTEDIEVQNIFSEAQKFLMNELHISRSTSSKIIYHIEFTDNKHWLRKNDYQAEFTNWLHENNCYVVQNENPKKWRANYYAWLKHNGKYKLNYNRPNLGNLIKEKYGIVKGHPDFNKIYSKLYKLYKKGKLDNFLTAATAHTANNEK